MRSLPEAHQGAGLITRCKEAVAYFFPAIKLKKILSFYCSFRIVSSIFDIIEENTHEAPLASLLIESTLHFHLLRITLLQRSGASTNDAAGVKYLFPLARLSHQRLSQSATNLLMSLTRLRVNRNLSTRIT